MGKGVEELDDGSVNNNYNTCTCESMVSVFIRCTMRCEIWAQPAELPR